MTCRCLSATVCLGGLPVNSPHMVRGGDGGLLACHVDDGIGILQVLFQNLDGLGDWQNQQLDL
jgi:hypothetical protein